MCNLFENLSLDASSNIPLSLSVYDLKGNSNGFHEKSDAKGVPWRYTPSLESKSLRFVEPFESFRLINY